ncbi:hypothetical protein RND81_13G206600 [Saponaria officinalis]|uniref:Pectinesterase inhibitor domain-containing protein n=1 Tax=Saponaria officinalis TaxID=3572 RepID=A0AAW1H0B1_SAPOF
MLCYVTQHNSHTKNCTKLLSMTPMYVHVSSSITLLIFLIFHAHSISTIESFSSSPNTTVTDDYIRKCCNVTLYQFLCYTSLSGHYTGPTDDLGSLTCAAIRVSLTEATAVADYVASVNWTASTSQVVGLAVRDCTKLTKAAVGQVRQSLTLMAEVVDASGGAYNETEGKRLRFDLNSVQTWMSAGITDQTTCMQGFKDVGAKDDDQVETQVHEKVWVVIKLISNALALVNSYVDDVFHYTQILV